MGSPDSDPPGSPALEYPPTAAVVSQMRRYLTVLPAGFVVLGVATIVFVAALVDGGIRFLLLAMAVASTLFVAVAAIRQLRRLRVGETLMSTEPWRRVPCRIELVRSTRGRSPKAYLAVSPDDTSDRVIDLIVPPSESPAWTARDGLPAWVVRGDDVAVVSIDGGETITISTSVRTPAR